MRTDDPETTDHPQWLESVVPDLEELEESLAAERWCQVLALEQFALAEPLSELEKLIAEQRDEFDALDFVGQLRMGSGKPLWGDEEFQSNLLAWLLDPQRGHGIADYFLSSFLRQTDAPSHMLEADWSAAEVHREWVNLVDGQWGYLDILVLNETGSALCAIENKVFSSEHSEQLTRYRRALAERYPDFTRHHVFLTPGGIDAHLEEERGFWVPAAYATVLDIVQQVVDDKCNLADENVRAFLRQYATTLRRNIVPDTSIAQRARQIYLQHREVMDIIIENQVDWVVEAKQMLKEAVAGQKVWRLDVEDRDFVRFRSADWDQFGSMQTGSGWAPRSGALLLFQFRFYDGLPWLDLALSTGNADNNPVRAKLFDAVRQHPTLFKVKTASLIDGWVILHEEPDYMLDDADYGVGWDDGSVRDKIEAWVSDFAINRFPPMNQVIVDCLREYEAEQQDQ